MARSLREYDVLIEEDGASRYYCHTCALSKGQAKNNGRHRYCLKTYGVDVSEADLWEQGRIRFRAEAGKKLPARLPRFAQPLLPGLGGDLSYAFR